MLSKVEGISTQRRNYQLKVNANSAILPNQVDVNACLEERALQNTG